MEMRPPSRIARKIFQPSPRPPSIWSAEHAAVLEEQLARGARVQAQLVLDPPDGEARACRPVTMNALISGEPSGRVPVRAVTM